MKIIHCCLAAFYIDNYGYQENILPKYHKLDGHDVYIVASTETYSENKTLCYVTESTYVNEYDIPVTRLPYVEWLPPKIARKFRLYKGLKDQLLQFEPDIIFLHDIQFIDVLTIVNYVKLRPNVKVYADGHTDFINSARSALSKYFLHGVIYRWCAKKIEPYVETFFGVTPLRSDFFSDMYKIDKSKIELLPLGYDDSLLATEDISVIRDSVRAMYDISTTDFVIVTGGKIDERKKIHLLIEVFNKLSLSDTKLLVFGESTPDMEPLINKAKRNENIIFAGWSKQEDIYRMFLSSDIAVFPGTHSVLWEQAVGLGVPCIFKRWSGMDHVDLGGNCIMLEESCPEQLYEAIVYVYNKREALNEMKRVSQIKGKEFCYSSIARRSIGLE
ncbi:hypothetical protein BCT63_03675 [Vibrio kanaloae]|uniref:glycosyltransferase family 4 protein n=1 Tax=Vibrio kanaloae TaxID=170673 RepID=UPI000C859106|nr:glycosyltransferase family 4 protein [Vibrio kanaloae]PMM08648.1 hypothetical protein BCT63_03675 [Vibrio kanaloae]